MSASEDKAEKTGEEPEVFPRSFGAYKLLGHLGTGGMGDVYLAARAGFAGIAKLCVVKTLRAGFNDDREYVTRFLDEARIVVQLNHKNICPVFEVGKIGPRHFLAMEYIAGRDLRTAGQRAQAAGRPLDAGLALFVVSEVLEALDYAHRLTDPITGAPLCLVHRDVSPHNVMIGFEGDVRLIDFGLAASTMKTEMTAPNVVMGKVAYMSQEQICGEHLDARADQFSAALLAYELYSGERFYEDRSPRETYQMAAQGNFRPKRFAELPDDLRAVLERGLAQNREDRFATCGEMREAVEAFRYKSGLRGDGPALRTVMQSVFGPELAAERTMVTLLGTTSAPIPAAKAEMTVSARSASAPVSAPAAEPSAAQERDAFAVDQTHATTSVPAARAPSAESTLAVRRASGTLADLEMPPRPRRTWLVAAALALAAVAAIAIVLVPAGQTPTTRSDAGTADDLPAPPLAPLSVDVANGANAATAANGANAATAANGAKAANAATPTDATPANATPANAAHATSAATGTNATPGPGTTHAAHAKKPAEKRAKPPPGRVPVGLAYLKAFCPTSRCYLELKPFEDTWARGLAPDALDTFKKKLDACVAACNP